MREHEEAILKSLVAVAWVDGRMDGEEKEMLEAVISAFELAQDDAQSIRDYAATPRNLADIPVDALEPSDRRQLLQHAVILTYVDGEQSAREKELLDRLVDRLAIPADEAKELVAASVERAHRLVDRL